MTNVVRTEAGDELLERIKPDLRTILHLVNGLQFDNLDDATAATRETVSRAWAEAGNNEYILADLFVLDRYLDMLAAYGRLWHRILAGEFAASWNDLQDAFDALRIIKRFSSIDVEYFEGQLLELEQAYPYRMYVSIGATVSLFECSICSCDIDSFECPHRQGELYLGKMAYGIARDIREVDHISIVLNPEDKRCVIIYKDTAQEFHLIRYIRDLISSGSFHISDFSSLRWSKRREPNPGYENLGRNDRCFCSSGKKFKHCCIDKKEVERDHVDVIAEPFDIENAVA